MEITCPTLETIVLPNQSYPFITRVNFLIFYMATKLIELGLNETRSGGLNAVHKTQNIILVNGTFLRTEVRPKTFVNNGVLIFGLQCPRPTSLSLPMSESAHHWSRSEPAPYLRILYVLLYSFFASAELWLLKLARLSALD